MKVYHLSKYLHVKQLKFKVKQRLEIIADK